MKSAKEVVNTFMCPDLESDRINVKGYGYVYLGSVTWPNDGPPKPNPDILSDEPTWPPIDFAVKQVDEAFAERDHLIQEQQAKIQELESWLARFTQDSEAYRLGFEQGVKQSADLMGEIGEYYSDSYKCEILSLLNEGKT